ncbi:MAG: TonB-dependent receptor domain-containing protein [Candidatus Cryptobacteroides sp.]
MNTKYITMKTPILKAAMLAAAMLIFCSQSEARILRQQLSTVKGTVVDAANGEPLGWATVALLDAAGNVVTGIACDEKGAYQLQAETGSYTVRVSMIGYCDSSLEVSLQPGLNTMQTIALAVDSQMLNEAKVTERVKLVEMKIDKVVMNVSQSAFSQGSNALDLIKKAPGVTIDKDGNIKLNGKTVQVWIDGRPSNVDGKSLESLLRSTNSESIERFELMEHPSAKYDAAGQGGIINIKTKKSIFQGLNGSMGLGGGAMHFSEIGQTPWQQSFWLNLNNRTKKVSTLFSIYEGFYNNPMQLINNIAYPDPTGLGIYEQNSSSVMRNFYNNYNVKLGADWFVNDKNTVGAVLYIPGDKGILSTDNSLTEMKLAGSPLMNTVSEINNRNNSIQYMANLNWTHIFDPARSSEMTANLDYFRTDGHERNLQLDTTFTAGIPAPAQKTINSDRAYDVYSAKLDYQSVVFGKYMLEAGAKYALSITDNSSLEKATAQQDLLNDIIYKEHIGALYTTFAGQLSPQLSFKLGLRGEYTHSAGDWISAGDKTQRSYFDLFPTVFLGWNPNEKLMLMASYSRRIQRPYYSQLNPTKTYIDARTYTVGNPDIQPMYSSDFALTANYRQHYSLSLGFDASNNSITQVPSIEPETGVSLLMWDNYGRNLMAYAAASVSALPVTKWMQWTLNLTGVYINSTNMKTEESRKSLSCNVYTALSFVLPKDWKIDMDGYWRAPMVVDTYRVHSGWGSNIAIKKNLLGDRMTLAIKLDDIFRSYEQNIDMIIDGAEGTSATILQKYYNQKLVFDLTWNFGTAHKTRQRKVGVLDEMSRAGSGSLGK